MNVSKPPVNTLIDKTKGLKLEVSKNNVRQTENEAEHVKKNLTSKTDRPIGVEDIDKKDLHNPFLVAVYAKDIYCYLRNLEVGVKEIRYFRISITRFIFLFELSIRSDRIRFVKII